MTQNFSSPKNAYSCKRKKDYITFLGIGLFLFVVAFELYLVLWVPLQIKSGKLLEKEVARQSMISTADELRTLLRTVKTETKVQAGEITLARTAIDGLAFYIRENQELLDRAQIRTLEKILQSYGKLAVDWENAQFLVKEERLDCSSHLKSLKLKAGIEAAPKSGKTPN